MAALQKSYFAIIPAPVRYDKELPANAKLMYGEITALANERGYCWAGNEYFAELYNVAPETISRWISKLQKAGYIKVVIEQKEASPRKIFIAGIPLDKNINSSKQKDQEALDEKIKHNSIVNNTVNNTPLIPQGGDMVPPSSGEKKTTKTTGTKQAPKEKKIEPEKIAYREAVSMTEEEYAKLEAEHGAGRTNWMLDKLDNYKMASGKKYKSDYRAILSWVVDEARKNCKIPAPAKGASSDSELEALRARRRREAGLV